MAGRRGDRSAAIEEEELMYGAGDMAKQALDEQYPNRPHNKYKTPHFSHLISKLFNPLIDQRRSGLKSSPMKRKLGPHGTGKLSTSEARRHTIIQFIDGWRRNVGDDFFPAMRLIIPDKDRDRAMYGIKEATLAKLLIKVMGLDKNSADAQDLLHWKLPGFQAASAMAGDFAGRCREVLAKRQTRSEPGDLSIALVNHMLDQLSTASKEDDQFVILKKFYVQMNAEELMWLIRIILRQIKIGSTERTILTLWHKDAENLFNISSNLRRVCWELYDPDIELEQDNRGINLMQCFQPQLAQFQQQSIEKMVDKMKPVENDTEFWIEEKLDGERMQMHMMEDESMQNNRRFGYWSRKATDYSDLYGEGVPKHTSGRGNVEGEDSSIATDGGALSKHLKNAFKPGVRNIILDGEMIVWDRDLQYPITFGKLKTAAIAARNNIDIGREVPVFKVFDCLYLNDKDLTRYTLRDRRKALVASVQDVQDCLEIHEYSVADNANEVHNQLRQIVASRGEGLVLKNPRSAYKLNQRNDDWMKVKPEYMAEFGESLDCVVIGAYYGTGRRGGALSSFLCGLREYQERIDQGTADPQFCYSFFKVGGGFNADDYQQIREKCEGKWRPWDKTRPPNKYIKLGGEGRQYEAPDVWIKPEDSVVLEVKAASVWTSDQFGFEKTLRFPRFKRLRTDKDWTQALSISEFNDLHSRAEREKKENEQKNFEVAKRRPYERATKRQKVLTVQGQNEQAKATYAGPKTKVFDGKTFIVLTDAQKPLKKTKAEIKELIVKNGGIVVAARKDGETIIISDRKDIHTAAYIRKEEHNIVRPKWLYDCVKQYERDGQVEASLLPYEPGHLFYTRPQDAGVFEKNVNEYGDAFAREVDVEELRALLQMVKLPSDQKLAHDQVLELLSEQGFDPSSTAGYFFAGLTAFFDDQDELLIRRFEFAGGRIAESLGKRSTTHVVVKPDSPRLTQLSGRTASLDRPPRMVTPAWIGDCWKEKTRLDEEQYVPT